MVFLWDFQNLAVLGDFTRYFIARSVFYYLALFCIGFIPIVLTAAFAGIICLPPCLCAASSLIRSAYFQVMVTRQGLLHFLNWSGVCVCSRLCNCSKLSALLTCEEFYIRNSIWKLRACHCNRSIRWNRCAAHTAGSAYFHPIGLLSHIIRTAEIRPVKFQAGFFALGQPRIAFNGISMYTCWQRYFLCVACHRNIVCCICNRFLIFIFCKRCFCNICYRSPRIT